MSKDPISQQAPQHDAAPAATSSEDATFGLRADLYAQIMQMSPGDSTALAEMIENYPGFLGKILMVASPHMGNAAVQRAIAIVKQMKSVSGAAGTLGRDETRATMGDAAPHALSGSEMIASLHDASDGPLTTGSDAAPKRAAAEPAWVAGARAYNQAHSELVDEFNELTSDNCRLDGAAEIDPQAVARWQTHHGLAADGKVGHLTVAAARKLKTKAPEVAAAPQLDARPPV
jgi:hypothetical protein